MWFLIDSISKSEENKIYNSPNYIKKKSKIWNDD